jgi:hypothetical protein
MNRTTPRSQTRIITPPATLPVSVAAVCEELNLPTTDAARVERLIRTATELAETYTNRSFINRTIELQLDEFPTGRIPWWDGVRQTSIRAFTRDAIINLPKPPTATVASVQYRDLANELRTVPSTTYFVDTKNEPGRLILNYGSTWPVDARDRAAVLITYTAGYGTDPAMLPSWIATAIIAHVTDAINRPNASVSSESIDNASVTYGNTQTVGTANLTGGLRGDASVILQPHRVMDLGG